MRTDALKLTCDKLNHASFVGFRGKEYISRPYELELFFTLPVGTSAKEAVGHRAKVEVLRGDGTDPVAFHGVIAGVRLLHQMGERALYRALLVPRLWMLRHFRRSNVFTFKKLQEFLGETLEDGGLQSDEFRFAIDPGQYAEEEFVAQYRESHLDFFHRWLEREGLYYYFEHKPDADGEVLVIVDDKGQHEAFAGSGRVRYFPIAGEDMSAPEALHHIETDTNWLPKSLTIEDYDYSNPSSPLKGESSVSKTGFGVIHDYGYRVFVDKDVKRLATVRAQAIGCRASTLRADGDALGPRAGYTFAIDDRAEDIEEEWLAVEVEHSGSIGGWTPEMARLTGLNGKDVYRMSVFAVPAAVQYRAPQSTPWPRVYGFENGTVGGPADSQYAQIDADGRYLVRFEFDQSALTDPKVSTRIRMLQPHGGETEGFHFPLRKDTEVMVAFLGGDPDRPFIAGVVPNALKPSVVGERNHTQNIIRTGGNNQIVMEDEEGKEFIFMHTPNQSSGIYMGHPAGRHSSVYTGEDEASTYVVCVGPGSAAPSGQPTPPGAQTSIDTTASMHLHTELNHVFFIGGSSTTIVDSGPENTYVGGDVVHGYKGTYGLMIGQASNEFYYATRDTTTFAMRTDTHKAGFTHIVEAAGMTQTITDKLDQTIHGPWTNTTDGKFHGKFSGESVQIMADGGKLSMHANTAIYLNAPDIYLDATNIHFTAAAKIALKAAKVSTDAADWKCSTPKHLNEMLSMSFEVFGGKNSMGIEKMDVTALKGEVTGASRSAVGSKMELAVSSRGIALTKADTVVTTIKQEVTHTSTSAAKVFTNGFFKL